MIRKLLRPPRRRLVSGLVLLVVLSAGIGGWLLLRDDTPAAATTTTATVGKQTLEQTVTASGTVAAAKTADLSFEVGGTVTRVYVAAGDKVTKGQRLAAVNADVLQAQLDAAESSLEAAQTTRSEHLSAGASSEQLAADKASVLAAQSSLAEARAAVADAVLRATISGTVTAVGIEVGDTVGSGAPSSGSGTDTTGTISIVSGGRFQVDAKVASGDVAKVKKGMQAELSVSGVAGTVYGTVAEVGLVAETDSSGAAVFPVTVDVTGKRTDLYAGTSADVAIIVSRRTDVLTVDSRALKTDGTTTYVEKVTDAATGATTRVDVKTGETSGLLTEVTSGLADGDVVQVPGFTLPGGTGGNNQQQQFRQRLQNGGGFPEGGFPGGGVPNFPGGPQ